MSLLAREQVLWIVIDFNFVRPMLDIGFEVDRIECTRLRIVESALPHQRYFSIAKSSEYPHSVEFRQRPAFEKSMADM